MSRFTPEERARAVVSPRYTILSQLEARVADFTRYEAELLREPRLLVPIDVCALRVRDGDESMVRLPFRDGGEGDFLGLPDDPGAQRPPGVHLLWTLPKAFGRGRVVDDPSAPDDPGRRVLELPVLPDRWVVLRIAVPAGSLDPVVRGWVVEADQATVTPLEDWPNDRTRTVSVGSVVPPDRLTVHVGGAAWTSCYDAAQGRLALHDPLDDLQNLDGGVEADSLSYVVAGWWSDSRRDPLDGVGSLDGYHRRLLSLGWDDPDHPIPDRIREAESTAKRKVSESFGIDRAERFMKATPEDARLNPAVTGFIAEARAAAIAPGAPTRATLLHGRIHGVPVSSDVRPDDRPKAHQVRVALGPSGPSVAALLASGALTDGANDATQRNAERLLTAFGSGLLARIEQPDTWPDVEQYEHAQEFGSQPGGVEATDRLLDHARAGNDPGGSRAGRRTKHQRETITLAPQLLWSREPVPAVLQIKPTGRTGGNRPAPPARPPAPPAPVARDVDRPSTPYFIPLAPVMAITGPGRRILAAERDEADGTLSVRLGEQPCRGLGGVVSSKDLIATLGNGAVPEEILTLARETIGEDPYLALWRTKRLSGAAASPAAALRIVAESAVNYAWYAGDNERLSNFTFSKIENAPARQVAVEGLLKHSLSEGVWSHPEGVTMWGQPWRPLFCEWVVELDLAGLAELAGDPGWNLGEIDLERVRPYPGGEVITFNGRSPLVTSVAGSLAGALKKWLDDERARDTQGHGLASEAVEAAMADLQGHLAELDALSVTLDGVRERLLGLRYDRGLVRRVSDAAADGSARAVADALPRLVAAGRLRVTRARLVDAFGRVLPLPVDSARIVARSRDAHAGSPALALSPRLNAPTRLHLRLVDPMSTDATAGTAFVDQKTPAAQINPVAGFLLPDHIDEALEMFAADGTPLGQVSHDGFSDAVFWEGAPGRTDIGPGAGPLDDPDATRRRLGWIAAGLVTVDAATRQATPNRPQTESPLSALLRAVDTTLWTVDPLGSMGREHIAGLVGRPIAVVTAHLTLDVKDDLDELVYGGLTSREARAQAYAELAAIPFTVRLGSATRTDDGLLGYFVDDDFSHLHVVDRAVAELAHDAGRCRGHMGVTGTADTVPIDHPYVVTGGTLTLRYGQVVRLTMLMHPGGKVHVTGGLVPRTHVALARDWVQPGLSVMAPSVRVGPLLIDADKVRLPKVAAFPADQLFTRRDSPGSWKDDPILSATQAAYLPDQASEVQEGWIRIAPTPRE